MKYICNLNLYETVICIRSNMWNGIHLSNPLIKIFYDLQNRQQIYLFLFYLFTQVYMRLQPYIMAMREMLRVIETTSGSYNRSRMRSLAETLISQQDTWFFQKRKYTIVPIVTKSTESKYYKAKSESLQ